MPDLKKLITLEALQAALPSWLKSSSKPSYTADEISDTNTTNKFVTSADKSTWNAKGTYSKPTGGIPKTDLSSLVQSSLDKADSAVQTETDPTVPTWAKQTNKPSYTQDEVTDGTTYKRVTSTEKNTWNNKQNALTTSQMQAVNSGITSEGVTQISTNQTNILYNTENGIKNILPVAFESRTTYGVTCTNNGDGSITVNGTNSQSSGTIIIANIQSSVRGGYDDPRNFLGKNKDYVLVGNTTTANLRIQVLGWNSSSDNSILASSTTDAVSFNTGNWNYISVRIWAQGSATFDKVVIKPMICTAESYAQSTTYQPPALSNSALTEGLIDAIDTNGKNRLKLDIDWIKANNTGGSWSGNEYTYKGVKFTLNDDDTVSTTGTTTSDTVTFDLLSYKFVSGVTYRLSGCPAGGSVSTYRLGTRGTTFLRDFGLVDNTVDNVNVGDGQTRNIFIYIPSSNVDMTGKTYKPMLCTKAEWDTSPKFQPHAASNYDLTNSMSLVRPMNPYGQSTVASGSLDDINRTETRVYNNPSGLPAGTSGFVICETIVNDGSTATQTITFISGQSGTIYGQSYPKFFRCKISKSWRDWMIVDTNRHYRLISTNSDISSAAVDISSIPDGAYLLRCSNSASSTTRYGISLYTLLLNTTGATLLFNPIVEVTNARISNLTRTDNTLNFTFDHIGHHVVALTTI